MVQLSQLAAFTILAAATLTGGAPTKRQIGQVFTGDGMSSIFVSADVGRYLQPFVLYREQYSYI